MNDSITLVFPDLCPEVEDERKNTFIANDGKMEIKGNKHKLTAHSMHIKYVYDHLMTTDDEIIPILINFKTKEEEEMFLKFWEALHSHSVILKMDSIHKINFLINLYIHFAIDPDKICTDPVLKYFYDNVTMKNIYDNVEEYQTFYELFYPTYIYMLKSKIDLSFFKPIKEKIDIIIQMMKEGKKCYFGHDDNKILTKEEYEHYKNGLNNTINDNTSLCVDVQNLVIKYL